MPNLALITGASGGIGLALAHEHCRRGGDAVLVARNKQALEAARKELESAYGVSVLVKSMDLTQPEAGRRLVDWVEKEGLVVEVLINNAGVGGHGKFVSRSVDDDLAMLQLNMLTLTTLMHRFLPQMVARDAPISSFNAGSLGAYADLQTRDVHPPVVEQVEEAAPRVVAEGPPPVDVVALKPAWIRVYFDDGSVLFEKILDAGERYRIPSDVDGAKLRAGNAGAVFVMVGDNTYGPVGNRGGVVRDVALGKENVTETMALATDLFTTPLAPPLNGMNPVADASGSN